MPPDVQLEEFKIQVVVKAGATLAEVVDDVKSALITYLQSRAPGETIYRGKIIEAVLQQVETIETVDVVEPDFDITPEKQTKRIGTSDDLIQIL